MIDVTAVFGRKIETKVRSLRMPRHGLYKSQCSRVCASIGALVFFD
jgi:hypothetical protein